MTESILDRLIQLSGLNVCMHIECFSGLFLELQQEQDIFMLAGSRDDLYNHPCLNAYFKYIIQKDIHMLK